MKDLRPGLNPRCLIDLMQTAIERCRLDLSGTIVLTEAASGAYVVTPVLAAMAGAVRVFAITRSTPYGSVEDVATQTEELARRAGVDGRLIIVTEKTAAVVSQADIVTNSGHVRPIDSAMVRMMKPSAVIPLMYEAWDSAREMWTWRPVVGVGSQWPEQTKVTRRWTSSVTWAPWR